MKWLLLIPVLLVVLLWLPLSVRVRYNSRLTVWAGVGPLLARVYETTGESPEPPKPEPEQKQDTPKEKKKKKSLFPEKVNAGLVLDLAASLPAPLAKLLRRVHIHHTAVRILTTGSDAAEAAVRAGLSPESEEGKEICALHRRWLTITGNQYDPARHRGIAELYVMDERFTAYYDKRLSGCARFLRDAVAHWAK